MKLNVIPKEKAVFWMDERGRWHNVHGRIEHPRIIKYFHASIQKDESGYFLYQEFGDIQEKVYFPYQETALFVFDVIVEEEITLELNTKKNIKLVPEDLFIKGDQLFMKHDGDKVKFTENALLKLADCFQQKDNAYFFSYKGQELKIGE